MVCLEFFHFSNSCQIYCKQTNGSLQRPSPYPWVKLWKWCCRFLYLVSLQYKTFVFSKFLQGSEPGLWQTKLYFFSCYNEVAWAQICSSLPWTTPCLHIKHKRPNVEDMLLFKYNRKDNICWRNSVISKKLSIMWQPLNWSRRRFFQKFIKSLIFFNAWPYSHLIFWEITLNHIWYAGTAQH